MEHEVDRLVRLADRIVVVEDGRVVADDTPLAIFSGPDVLGRVAGERLPAAAELLGRLASAQTFPPLSPTLDLDEALELTAAQLGARW